MKVCFYVPFGGFDVQSTIELTAQQIAAGVLAAHFGRKGVDCSFAEKIIAAASADGVLEIEKKDGNTVICLELFLKRLGEMPPEDWEWLKNEDPIWRHRDEYSRAAEGRYHGYLGGGDWQGERREALISKAVQMLR